MIEAYATKVLQKPVKVTDGGVSGSWVDLAGYVTEHEIKAVFLVGIGTTPGTAAGYIQASDSSTGAGATTVSTFVTQTSAGGSSEKHFTTTKRYVNFVGDAQTGKNMYESCVLFLRAHNS